jgi:glutamate--cysteine ligase
MIDAQPGDGWVVPVSVASALLSDPRAGDVAMAVAQRLWDGEDRGDRGDRGGFTSAGNGGGDREDLWLRAARLGPADPRIARASRACFAAARDALVRQDTPEAILAAVDDFIERYVSKDRCPADDLLEELR